MRPALRTEPRECLIPLVMTLVTLVILAGCTGPSPTISPLRLPTRIPRTPTPIPTPTITPIAAWKYYEQGVARQEAGDIQGAMQSFAWAIQQAPDYGLAYVARGTIYLSQGKLHLALTQADAALEADPTLAAAHALRGETLRLLGDAQAALDAFRQSTALDSDLKVDTFHSHWLAARAADNPVRLLMLSGEFGEAYPNDPLRYYYRGWAFIEMDRGTVAARTLAEGIEATSDSPALLWFVLGQAYVASHAWEEAVTAFEATRVLVQSGDTSLTIHSEQPIVDLFVALGQAYLKAGRCADAEVMLQYATDIGAPASELSGMLEESRMCQTPTPTVSPKPTLTF